MGGAKVRFDDVAILVRQCEDVKGQLGDCDGDPTKPKDHKPWPLLQDKKATKASLQGDVAVGLSSTFVSRPSALETDSGTG